MGAVGAGGFERSVPRTDPHVEDLPQISPREIAFQFRRRIVEALSSKAGGRHGRRFGSHFAVEQASTHWFFRWTSSPRELTSLPRADGEISSLKLEKTHTISLAAVKTLEDDHSRSGAAAQSRVERGQVSRARHELTGAPLAPKNATTLEALQRKRLVEQASPIPQAVLDFVPELTLQLDKQLFVKCL